MQVSLIRTNQTQTEEKADWDNDTEVCSPIHFDSIQSIEERCSPSQDLSTDRCEGQVPCREKNGKV